jgi:AcrR family transcriptional regulator
VDREKPETPLAARPRNLRPRRQPLQARSQRRRESILEAAEQLLVQRGAEATTTAAIAKRAGVPIGSVYSYFPSREAILVELASRRIGTVAGVFVSRLQNALERLPWRQALDDAVANAVAVFRDDPAFVAVWRTMRRSPEFREVAEAADERFARTLASLRLLSHLPASQRRLKTRAAIRIANSFLEWSLEAASQREASAIVLEMVQVVIAYLAPDLDTAEPPTRRKAVRGRR